MAYLDLNAPLRSNQSFRDKQDSFYHKDSSPLEEFPIDIISTVVLEYMHNICLGVMKKLIVFWVKGKKPVRLVDPNAVSEELINLKCYLPSEFNRLPRSLEECEHWKATEFRTFLLYTGPIVLKGRLKKPLFKHFMLLNYAIRLLISSENCYTQNNLAKDMLKRFVQEYGSLYGEGYVGYNVHGLIHLADFVLIHGHLDLFSAFKYENYLQFLKKSCKNDRFPLQDAYNRIMENIEIQINKIISPIIYPTLKRESTFNTNSNNSLTETMYEEVVLEKFLRLYFAHRALYNYMKHRFNHLPIERNISIDEQMVPFKGKLAPKQYMRGKPHPWGIKLFIMCGSSRIVYDFIMFQGSSTELDPVIQNLFGQGEAVVMKFIERLEENRHFLYFDNYFTSYNLLSVLADRKIYAAGTIRVNRFANPPLITDKCLSKMGRGTSYEVSEIAQGQKGEIGLIKWFDNKGVNLGSNFITSGEPETIKRWDKKHKKFVDVERPEVIGLYNKSMGGVDVHDQLVSFYRTFIKSRKWTLRLIAHAFDMASVNIKKIFDTMQF
ncbi:uncharacterized protein LOC112603960 [Melanaphis sacchari]|uniref:uncharacterized protein LOC112603960 n=1 Tax=Melanaphis sacchari TaxID=742174 RepID=UPI000DC14648|nr:uncharacterized protein LOC112603960 [Melanaphis sacchari]